MPKSEYPVLHADQHLADGSDPLPGWSNAPSGAPIVYSDYVLSLGPLGYWRLGETGTPWADTSGSAGGPRNMTLASSGTPAFPLTADVTGGLPTAQDDGAVQFNYAGTSFTNTGEFLQAGVGASAGNYWALNHMTVSAFVKLVDGGPPRVGYLVSNEAYVVSGSYGPSGWALYTQYPDMWVGFVRWRGAGVFVNVTTDLSGLVADTWYHVAASYDGTTMKMYLNGELVDTNTDTSNVAAGVNNDLYLGYNTGNFEHRWASGSLDEVAVWNVVLTDDQIATLGSVLGTGADAGKVLLADGAGGTSWEFFWEVTY